MSRVSLLDGTVRWRLLLACCLALLGLGASLFAQHYNFKVYGLDEGLGNLSVECLVQDRTGFMWIGTKTVCSASTGASSASTAPPRPHRELSL